MTAGLAVLAALPSGRPRGAARTGGVERAEAAAAAGAVGGKAGTAAGLPRAVGTLVAAADAGGALTDQM